MDAGLTRSLVRAVAEELRERVIPRYRGGFLPGSRVLAKTLGVSVPTVCKALHVLGSDRVVNGGGDRRRWRVPDTPPGGEPGQGGHVGLDVAGSRTRRLLFLSTSQLSGERFTGVEVFAALLDKLARSDWEVMYREIRFMGARKPRRIWDELLAFTKPDAMVVLGGTEVIGKWAEARNIRTLFLGGTRGQSNVPVIAVKVPSMLRDAAGRLLALGHRRMLFPLCARSPEFVETVRASADAVTAGAGIPRSAIALVTSQYSGSGLMVDLLRREWRKEPPDALILLDWREFVAAEAFFNEAGIVIPRDLSVIVLSHNATMEWHQPRISHYEHPVTPLARAVSNWVRNDKPRRGRVADKELKAVWVSQQSVMPRAGSQAPRPEVRWL